MTQVFWLPHGRELESSQGPNSFLSLIKEYSVNLAIIDCILINNDLKCIYTTKTKEIEKKIPSEFKRFRTHQKATLGFAGERLY